MKGGAGQNNLIGKYLYPFHQTSLRIFALSKMTISKAAELIEGMPREKFY